MVVLGCDPGIRKGSAWAVYDPETNDLFSGVLKPEAGLTDADMMIDQAGQLQHVIEELHPDVLGIETQWVPRGRGTEGQAATAVRLGAMRGALVATAGLCGLEVVELAPATIKLAIAGHGRASKQQVQAAIKALFGVQLSQDKADAAAIAVAAERRAGRE